MTALETQSSRELFKGSTENKEGLRQRRDKEQMVLLVLLLLTKS